MSEEVKKNIKSKRLKASEWATAEAYWKSGEFTLEQLSEMFNIRTENFSRRFKRLGIKKGSEAEAVMSKLEEMTPTSKFDTLENIVESRDKFKSGINAAFMFGLGRVVKILQAKEEAKTLNLKDLDYLQKYIGGADTVMKILGVSPEDVREMMKNETDETPVIEVVTLDEKGIEAWQAENGTRVDDPDDLDDLDDEAFLSDEDEFQDEMGPGAGPGEGIKREDLSPLSELDVDDDEDNEVITESE